MNHDKFYRSPNPLFQKRLHVILNVLFHSFIGLHCLIPIFWRFLLRRNPTNKREERNMFFQGAKEENFKETRRFAPVRQRDEAASHRAMD
jgi:hypothetical protein